MSSIDVPLERGRFGQTARRDHWWVQPLLTFLGLGTFIVYSTWAALQGDHYRFGPYLSPFYSPELFSLTGDDSWFGTFPDWLPCFVTGAMLILWAPGGFRFTCYYYRGAYYKAFWADPPSCTVGEPRKNYLRRAFLPAHHPEHSSLFPVHRADLHRPAWPTTFGKLSGSTERLRHRRRHAGSARRTSFCWAATRSAATRCGIWSAECSIGSRSAPFARTAYDCVSCLNRRHMMFAWFSLFWVGFSDLYIRLCSMGIWTDWRIL